MKLSLYVVNERWTWYEKLLIAIVDFFGAIICLLSFGQIGTGWGADMSFWATKREMARWRKKYKNESNDIL